MGKAGAYKKRREIALNVERYVLAEIQTSGGVYGKNGQEKETGLRPGRINRERNLPEQKLLFGKPVDGAEISVKLRA